MQFLIFPVFCTPFCPHVRSIHTISRHLQTLGEPLFLLIDKNPHQQAPNRPEWSSWAQACICVLMSTYWAAASGELCLWTVEKHPSGPSLFSAPNWPRQGKGLKPLLCQLECQCHVSLCSWRTWVQPLSSGRVWWWLSVWCLRFNLSSHTQRSCGKLHLSLFLLTFLLPHRITSVSVH